MDITTSFCWNSEGSSRPSLHFVFFVPFLSRCSYRSHSKKNKEPWQSKESRKIMIFRCLWDKKNKKEWLPLMIMMWSRTLTVRVLRFRSWQSVYVLTNGWPEETSEQQNCNFRQKKLYRKKCSSLVRKYWFDVWNLRTFEAKIQSQIKDKQHKA